MQTNREPSQIGGPPTWLPFLAGTVLIWGAAIGSQTLVHSSLEHWKIGLIMGAIFGSLIALLVAIPLSALAYLLVQAFANKSKFTASQRFGLLCLPALVTSCLLLSLGLSSLDIQARFQRHVMKPIPASVRVLSAEGFTGFLAHRWLLIFDISPGDFDALVTACGLEKLPPSDYLGALDSYTSKKVEPLVAPHFYGWSASNQVPNRWRNVVANSNHTRVYFMTGFQK